MDYPMLVPLRQKQAIPRQPCELQPGELGLGKLIAARDEHLAQGLGGGDQHSLQIAHGVVPDEPVVGHGADPFGGELAGGFEEDGLRVAFDPRSALQKSGMIYLSSSSSSSILDITAGVGKCFKGVKNSGYKTAL